MPSPTHLRLDKMERSHDILYVCSWLASVTQILPCSTGTVQRCIGAHACLCGPDCGLDASHLLVNLCAIGAI